MLLILAKGNTDDRLNVAGPTNARNVQLILQCLGRSELQVRTTGQCQKVLPKDGEAGLVQGIGPVNDADIRFGHDLVPIPMQQLVVKFGFIRLGRHIPHTEPTVHAECGQDRGVVRLAVRHTTDPTLVVLLTRSVL